MSVTSTGRVLGHVTLCHVTQDTPCGGEFFISRQKASCNVYIIWSLYLYPFESYARVPYFNFTLRDPDHAYFRGQFVMRWLHVIYDAFTK